MALGCRITTIYARIEKRHFHVGEPKFFFPIPNVEEDIPVGTSILKVKAADADSGSNADIEYYVSDDHFTVSSKGIVSNAKRLVS